MNLGRLDVVVEKAGLMSSDHEYFEGYERQFTVNIITTWLMALKLLLVMKQTSNKF